MRLLSYIICTCFIVFITSCSLAKPMTYNIDRQASRVGSIDKFQYYVSRNIVLTRAEATNFEGNVNSKGSLKITRNRDVVQVTSGTSGVLLKTEFLDGFKVYYIAFEADNDNCLKFKQIKNGSEEKIYLCYDNPENNRVLYGGEWYDVEWEGVNALQGSKFQANVDNAFSKIAGFFKGTLPDDEDNPYLKVKMNLKVDNKEQYRKASGRKVQ